MMKRLWLFLISNKLTVLAMIALAISMACATFVENDYGTPVARSAIYEAWWFEMLMLILAVNFVGNIFRYRLFRKEKVSVLLFHLAFVVILVGAFITRYTGQEGLVKIREGESSNHLISQERYFRLHVKKTDRSDLIEKRLDLTRFRQPSEEYTFGSGKDRLQVSIHRFVPDAVQGLIDSEGSRVVEIVAATQEGRSSFYLEEGGSLFINGHQVTFNNPQGDAINIEEESGVYWMESPEDLNYMVMSTQVSGRLEKSKKDTLRLKALYQSHHLNFVVSKIHRNKALGYETAEDKNEAKNAADLLFVSLKDEKDEQQIILASLQGVFSPIQHAVFSDYELEMSYGAKQIALPFSLYLKDFQLERYPGSSSPSSYASELIVEENESSFPVRISMNNVLDHKGYRFFQASYDLDEKGTVLSVNRDYWGTQVTYLGYVLMGLGMVLTLFGRGSRFRQVSQKLDQLRLGKAAVIFIGSLFLSVSSNQVYGQSQEITEVVVIDRGHAAEFGRLMVQDMDGRIKPINTLSSEFLRKLIRQRQYKMVKDGETSLLNSDQVFLSIHQDPVSWQYMPLIKVDQKKGKEILKIVGKVDDYLLSFRDLLDKEGGYKIQTQVEKAQRKKPAERSEEDNELIMVDERFNILYQALTGNYLRIFPQVEAPDNRWYDSNFVLAKFEKQDSIFVRNILSAYYQDIRLAEKSGDWSEAHDKLLYIRTFQDKMGGRVIPDRRQVDAELLYNELNLYNKLFPVFWVMGICLLVIALFRVFFHHHLLKLGYWLGGIIMALAYIALTGNMILRWYAGGYPPWSNGYEMIILVTWALFLFGFLFFRKSDFILPVVGLFGGTLMFVSYLDWLNPEITNLVPVLKSYWLKIHVAIIVSSYAPLALSALLGLLNLVFIIVKKHRLDSTIHELTYINELSMTIGLFMLSIGTFLGGVWANESWGRYWAWDPKETWALISIFVYAVVLHLRLIPTLRGVYTFNLASVLGFFSVMMTSFGVNYYLSGLHSYAAGDPLPIPQFIYWVIGCIFVIASGAYWRRSKLV